MNKWTRFKQDVMKSIHADTVNKRKTFENQLRQPLQMPVKFKDNSGNAKKEEAEYSEKDVLNINYLSSVDYQFKAAKQKRSLLELSH